MRILLILSIPVHSLHFAQSYNNTSISPLRKPLEFKPSLALLPVPSGAPELRVTVSKPFKARQFRTIQSFTLLCPPNWLDPKPPRPPSFQ